MDLGARQALFEGGGRLSEDHRCFGRHISCLFSAKKNVQLLLTKSGGAVSTDQFIKAFPVLSEEQKFKVESGPTKISVAGSSAVLYELQRENVPNYHTIYVYVGRAKAPYALIMNYPAPRDAAMVKLMKQVLATVKHQ